MRYTGCQGCFSFKRVCTFLGFLSFGLYIHNDIISAGVYDTTEPHAFPPYSAEMHTALASNNLLRGCWVGQASLAGCLAGNCPWQWDCPAADSRSYIAVFGSTLILPLCSFCKDPAACSCHAKASYSCEGARFVPAAFQPCHFTSAMRHNRIMKSQCRPGLCRQFCAHCRCHCGTKEMQILHVL